jgi:hypothetical protein
MPLLQTHGVGQGSQGAYCASLPADDLAHVAGSHTNLDQRGAFALNLAHVYRFNVVNQRPDNHLDGFFHILRPRARFKLRAALVLVACRWL